MGAGAVAALADVFLRRFGARPGDAPWSLDDGRRLLERLDDATVLAAAVARIRDGWRDVPPGRPYELDMLRPGDAPGVAQLMFVIYGDKYPVVDYYVPERLVELNRQGRLLTVVARLASGEIAGQGAFYQSSPPNRAIFEQGQLLVAPQYRNSSIAFRILQKLDQLSRTMPQAEGFFGEAVCNHLVTQKCIARQGYSECGLELALMPTNAYEKEGAGGRVSCLLAARVDRDGPGPLFVPECYRAPLERILEGFSLDRDIRFAHRDAPSAETTALEARTFDFAQVTRVQVATVGRDFPERLAALDLAGEAGGEAVLQVYLNAGAPGVAFAVEALRRRGFVFGGFLPRWFGPQDGLMLQKLRVVPDFEAIRLHSDRARALFADIAAEWRQRHGQG